MRSGFELRALWVQWYVPALCGSGSSNKEKGQVKGGNWNVGSYPVCCRFGQFAGPSMHGGSAVSIVWSSYR